MPVIDAHAHIFHPRIAPAAVQATTGFYCGVQNGEIPVPVKMDHLPGTAEDLLQQCRKSGIDRCVVFATATAPHQVELVNDHIARSAREHPELIGVGTMHPAYEDMEDELRRMKELGLVGVKLHPDIQRFDLDDERLWPMFEWMESENFILVAHTGDYRYDYSAPRRMARIAKAFPRLRCVAAHFGGWSEWSEARDCLRLDNVYMDTSSTLSYGAWDAARRAFDTFDPTHIFFGTDYPLWDPAEELQRFLSLKLGDRLNEMVLGENFENFLAGK